MDFSLRANVMVVTICLMVVGLAACARPLPLETPAQVQGPVTPVGSFNKVQKPHHPWSGNNNGGLSTDINWLQKAHRKYVRDKARLPAQETAPDCNRQPPLKQTSESGESQPREHCKE